MKVPSHWARRCGSIRRRAVQFLAAGAVVFILYLVLVPSVVSDGVVGRTIRVTVRNSQDLAIPNASVSLLQDRDELLASAMTKDDFAQYLKSTHHCFLSDEKGTGTLSGRFGAGWHNTLFGNSGHYLVEGTLVASHPDYFEIRAPLVDFTHQAKYPLWKRELNITVYMKRKSELK